MTIFEALRLSHDLQRELAQKLVATHGDSSERHALFAQLKQEPELCARSLLLPCFQLASNERHRSQPLPRPWC